ncbi:hypothetical protein MGSAQ_000749 [marine sediment metagenome]|uniref:Uncharacterized protein n=1 Tax=marine sediment metagenome TaxID=412755 RepID=A0A1B6NWI8_9ZZZZ
MRGQGGGLEIALTGDTYENIFLAAQNFSRQLEEKLPELGRPRIS